MLVLFTTSITFAQRDFTYEATGVTNEVISGTIKMHEEQTAAWSNINDHVVYINKPVELKNDVVVFGAGYQHKKETELNRFELSVGRFGSSDDRFRMTLNFGYYQVMERKATFAGGSFSFHPNENNFFGISVKDLYDVSTKNGRWNEVNDAIYFRYEAMSPTAFANIRVFDNNFESIDVYGDFMYNAYEKSTFTLAASFNTEIIQASLFYSKDPGASLTYKMEWVNIQASYKMNEKDLFSVGLIFKNIP